MVLLESSKIDLGMSAHDFSLPATDGKTYSLSDFAARKVLVVVFMCNHCPYVKAVLDRLIAIQRDYEGRGVRIAGINSNDSATYPDDSFENMMKMVEEKKVNFVYLRDEAQEVAKLYGAQCTPDIFVYDSDRKLCYHGRIDDNWQDSSKVTKTELRDALDALISGNKPKIDQNPSMGCSIKWR